MSGLGIKLYTDEDVDPALADQLKRAGYDALSCHEAKNANRSLSDEWQLDFATRHERAILVFNIADFIRRDQLWRSRGKEHWGIILAEQDWPIGELVRRAKCHLDSVEPSNQYNAVLYLAECQQP